MSKPVYSSPMATASSEHIGFEGYLAAYPSAIRVVAAVVAAMRPRQWTKNAVLFAGLVFAQKMTDLVLIPRVALAAFLFCLVSGAVYLINDIKDVEKDRLHPKKRLRPVASGRLSIEQARWATVVLVVTALPAAWALNITFGLITSSYLVMMLAYSVSLKNVVMLDVLIIAAGFVMRAAAGGFAAEVPVTPWLYVCASLLALFLGFGKRRQELVLLDAEARGHRKILEEYTAPLLDQLIAISASSTIIAYCLYTFFSETSHKAPYLMVTIPFVLYAVFRYLYLIHARDEGGSPEEVLLKDRPLLGTILLWGATAVAILYLSQ